MKILSLVSILTLAAHASDPALPKFPDEPSPAMVLEANKLKDADEMILLRFVESHWNSAVFSLAEVRAEEEKSIRDGYFRRIESQEGNAREYFAMAIAKLQQERLRDPRRIVDASLRALGQRGTGNSLYGFMSLSKNDFPGWFAGLGMSDFLTRRIQGNRSHRQRSDRATGIWFPRMSQ
jgi:hypothetical protein